MLNGWLVQEDEFNDEHILFSDKVDFHKKGFYYRLYPEIYYQILEKPFEINNQKYYPVLLDNTENYNRESATQSNCVKTYIGTPGSVIVSLRKNSQESIDRATIEFNIMFKNNNHITFTVPQALGRFNSKLTEEWDYALDEMKVRFFKCIKDDKFDFVKLKKVFNNGKDFF